MCCVGAVCFGVDPISSQLRRAMSTYAVCVTRPFVRGRDPQRKLLRRDGAEWCQDALDVLVRAGQQVCLGSTLVRRYTPAALAPPSTRRSGGSPPPPTDGSTTAAAPVSKAVLDVYLSSSSEVRYATDSGVVRCASLVLPLDTPHDVAMIGTTGSTTLKSGGVVELKVCFGSEELRLQAVDTASGRSVRTTVEFASSQ